MAVVCDMSLVQPAQRFATVYAQFVGHAAIRAVYRVGQ